MVVPENQDVVRVSDASPQLQIFFTNSFEDIHRSAQEMEKIMPLYLAISGDWDLAKKLLIPVCCVFFSNSLITVLLLSQRS